MITRLVQGSVLGSKNLGTIICFRKHQYPNQDIVFISSFRLILLLMTVLTILFTWLWLNDPNTSNTTLFTSLKAHPFFLLRFVTLTITKIIWIFSCSMLIISFVFGIHQRVVAPSILVQRIRLVLEDYGMSISQTGDLIIRR